jgi:hypothetical protein
MISSSHDFQSQVQKIVINGKEYKINCSVIAPYLDVLQHAGYTREGETKLYGSSVHDIFSGLSAVIVFQARKLPLKSEPNYAKIMHHLFLHFLLEISNLVADSYCLLVFTREGTLPPLKWVNSRAFGDKALIKSSFVTATDLSAGRCGSRFDNSSSLNQLGGLVSRSL